MDGSRGCATFFGVLRSLLEGALAKGEIDLKRVHPIGWYMPLVELRDERGRGWVMCFGEMPGVS